MDQRFPLPEPRTAPAPADAAAAERSGERRGLRLVGARTLALDCGGAQAGHAPDDWREALAALAVSHRIAIEPATMPASRAGGLRQVARWAAGAGQSPSAPVFAPWQAFSPAALQNPLARAALPQAQWLAGYLFDPAALRAGGSSGLDVLLASPHPAACLEDDTCHTALPRKGVLDAMIGAVRSQQRERLALIVPARARSALAQRLLAADRGLTRGDIAIEIIAIEEAIARLVRSAESWDAIIVLPELRGIIAAVLAEVSGLAGAWPLLWLDGGLVRVSSEAVSETLAPLPLDAAVLMQALALAADCGGLGQEARHLAASWIRLRDSGVATPTRLSLSPYGTQLDDAAFVALAGGDQPIRAGRPLPGWKALATPSRVPQGNQGLHSPVALSLVRS